MFRGTFLVYSERQGAKRAGEEAVLRGRETRGSGLDGESEVESLRLTGRVDFNFAGLRSERFVPGGYGVAAGRKVRNREYSVLAGNGKIRGFQDGEVSLHPGVQVALYRNELFVFVGVRERRGARGLKLAPLAVDLGEGMNVVGKRVVVGDFQLLACTKGED